MKKLSIILSVLTMVGCIAIAFLSDNMIVKCVGILTSIFTCISFFLTEKEIKALQNKSKRAVYFGEKVVDNAPEIETEVFK